MKREIKDNSNLWNLMQENKEKIISYLRKRYSPVSRQLSNTYYESTTRTNFVDYSLREADFEDIVYDAMITTYENKEKGKLKNELQTCELSLYLRRVCIYKANEKLRKNKRFDNYRKAFTNENTTGKINGSIIQQADKILGYCQESEYIKKETQSTVCEIVRNLPEPCKTILWGFYWDNLSLKELAENNEKIKNSESAKVIKHRCMDKFGKRLKEIGYER
jgi:RNA polymerase sigma factor (sigma-70 family)